MRQQYDFPYPILKNDLSSSYSNQCFFEIVDLGEAELEGNRFIIKIQFSLQCAVIEKYLEKMECSVYISYTSDLFKKMIRVNECSKPFTLEIPVGQLKSVDTIKIKAFVIADKDIQLEYSGEMDPIYDIGEPLDIKTKDIIAESNSLEFFYNRTGETIIQFKEVNDENFKDFRVDLSSENYITVQISHQFNEGYTKIKLCNKASSNLSLLNSGLVHLVLVYTLSELASNGYDEHIDKRWFKVLVQVFSARNIEIKKELDDMRDRIDIEKIYDFSQKFMNNYYEKSIVIAGKDAQ